MSYDKRKLAQHFRDVLASTRDDIEDSAHGKVCSVLGGAGTRIEMTAEDGRTFVAQTPEDGSPTLYVFDGRAQSAFVDECLKDDCFSAQIGPGAITKQLQAVLRDQFGKLDATADFEQIVKDQILKPLRSAIKPWRVRVPIANLKVSTAFKVGSTTFLRHEDGVVANNEVLMAWHGPEDNPGYTIATKAHMMNLLAQIAQQGLAWAEAEIQSHEGRVVEVAREQIDLAINVIRAFMRNFAPKGMRMGFGMPGEITSRLTTYFAATENSWTIPNDSHRMLVPFELTDAALQRLRADFSFDTFVRIAGAKWAELTSLEQAVRVAVQWLGRSVVALTVADTFTQCTIALERLLILNEEETTTEKFADRLTYLLADDPTERDIVHRDAKRLYDIRSQIVHAGLERIEEGDARKIELIALATLRKVGTLMPALKQHSDLRDLLQKRKMGHRDSVADGGTRGH